MTINKLLAAKKICKPWGRVRLPAPFSDEGFQQIGEIWFEDSELQLDLLIKYLFTSERLSIQVHPDDELAATMGLSCGKDECLFVLEAEPDAVLGIGTVEPLTPEEVRKAALDGSLARKIDWRPVKRGDFHYIPAGTVHAIGAGLTLIEVQQNVDVTYRLFDYGRERTLHLDAGISAMNGDQFSSQLSLQSEIERDLQLVTGPKFNVWMGSNWPANIDPIEPVHIVPIVGSARIGSLSAAAGDCVLCSPETPISPGRNFRALIAQAVSQAGA